MLKKFGKNLVVAGLNVLKYIIYIVCAPIVVVFALYGLYFIVAGFMWIVLVDAAFLTAVFVFCANFFMFFMALFNSDVWTTMGGMWTWLWSWFADGNIALWPHFVKSFPLYFITGIILLLLYEATKSLTAKAIAINNLTQLALPESKYSLWRLTMNERNFNRLMALLLLLLGVLEIYQGATYNKPVVALILGIIASIWALIGIYLNFIYKK